MQRMAGSVREKHHERKLRPPIAITKSMDSVEFSQERRRLLSKIISRQLAQVAVPPKVPKKSA